MHPLVKQLELTLPSDTTKICVALSGGLDSRVLFELARQLAEVQPTIQLRALHIHHQLSKFADDWAAFSQQICDLAQIPISIHQVDPQSLASASLEDRARRARYQVFEQELEEGEVLLQGHHQDDQVETLLLRLLRGAGTLGLASIPLQRPLGKGLILRPLLTTPRAELLKFAQASQLKWVEDDSNFEVDFDRNYLRLEILPLLQKRFPNTNQNLARVTQLAAESQQLNQDLAKLDLANCQLTEQSLNLEELLKLANYRQVNLLRYWLLSRNLTLPGHQIWQELTQLYSAQKDAQPKISWDKGDKQVEARRFQNQLFIAASRYFQPLAKDWQASWDGKTPVNTPAGSINFQLTHQEHQEIQNHFTLQARQGGEVLRQAKRGQRDAKRLLQELKLPPWQRQQLVFIWHKQTLVAIDKYLIAEGWQIIN
ncbi:tRNA lysidine(34) synthetase TilS [Marinospirillum insulare]|uniref:tRNA(Ile)-lysidine synthase n=1 Tax=Marinospirillum insulare TaxID=217169 RepID=A0ABQ6A0Q7_9GAMM|nr:tRNA lysidine(34) synthetase TilS [Marinospirillum insulare]GLR63719.1 tRNA(Ile)-lysidine synthase [Marinospirillum insulare]